MTIAEDARNAREQLAATPGIVRPPVPMLELFILRDFLSPVECDALIAMIDANRKPSRLLSDNPDAAFRTSETCNLDRQDSLVRDIDARIARLLGIDPRLGEILQGQRYDVGQQFKPHHDYLRPSEPYWTKQSEIGGQRTWTAMAFLNVPQRGGETWFPRVELTVPPRRGSLVVWNNLDDAGEPNPETLHAGLPVAEGVKYIVTKWYRERPWGVRREAQTKPI